MQQIYYGGIKVALYQRGKYWHFKFNYLSKQYRGTTKQITQLEALKYVENYIKEFLRLNSPNYIKDYSFNELALEFLKQKLTKGVSKKTFARYQGYITILRTYFGGKLLKDITKLDIMHYEEMRIKNGDQPAYIKDHFKVLNGMFNFAMEIEFLNHNPFDRYKFSSHLPNYKARIKFLTPAECQDIIRCCENNVDLKALVIVLLETAMRIGEALNVLHTDIAVDSKTRQPFLVIREEISKNKKQGFIPLTKLAMEQINFMRLKYPNSVVIFPNHLGRPYKEPPKLAFKRVLEKAGITGKGLLFHLLRHTAGSLWLQGKNIDGTPRPPMRIETISEVMRHSSIIITKDVYAKYDRGTVMGEFLGVGG
jgi:integrase